MPLRKTPVETRSAGLGATPESGRATRALGASPNIISARRRVVIVGAPADVPRAMEHPAALAGTLEVVTVLTIDIEARDHDEGIRELARLIQTHEAEAILVAGPVGPTTIRRVADIALVYHCELLAVMPTEVLAGHDPVVVWKGSSPLVQLARMPTRPWRLATKRAIDIAGAAVGLMLAAPVLAVLSVAIRWESRGPILFRHVRVGRNGRKFDCLKLRTMRSDAEDVLLADPIMYEEYRRNHYKIPERQDARVTLIGRLIRRTSLDELPQLWNVFIGDMSLVGPRPVVAGELEHYDKACDLLLSVKPGITGAWAVNGRHSIGYPERCGLELHYVRNWSLIEDLRILRATFRAVLFPSG